uniref:inositol 1,4,5-triphosphate receptor associated 2-like isoform X2 n=1 Tax=Pristiophorus japonicus TaxID=55135 RepID=UPI00398EA096
MSRSSSAAPCRQTPKLVCEIIAKDSIENSTEMSICSEEDVLNCTFESCDTEGKGEVYVSRIIEYLGDVTGQSCEKGQLRLLHKMLNPEERDVAVNLATFHNIMKQWIAECRQEGLSSGKNEEATSIENICILQTDKKSESTSGQLEGYGGDVNRGNLETTELINDIECLEYTNRKLVDQNAKLQRSVEGFEEANVRLTEEIFELKSKLKSSQQVLLHVKLLENELEDLKSIMKNLEDRNYKLQVQNRQLEKEYQNLSTRICQLQEENQMYEDKRLISVKDVLLTEKINQSEELKSTAEEYNNIIKGLKEEINRLQYHLTCEDLSTACGMQSVELQSPTAPEKAPEHSLQLEIEESQQKTDLAANNLPTPLCGMVPFNDSAGQIKDILYHICSQLNWMDFQAITEELVMQKEVEEETKGFLQKISSLFHTKIVLDIYKGNLAPQLTAVTQHYQTTERDSHVRNSVAEENEHLAVEECSNGVPHLKRLKEHQSNDMLATESGEGLRIARRLFKEIEVLKTETHRSSPDWRLFEDEDYMKKKSTGAAQETRSFAVENAAGQATETEWQLEFEMSPEHCTLHLDGSSQTENKPRCATSSVTVQLQRACQGLSHNIDQQQKRLELLYEELFLREEKSRDNNDIITLKKKSMTEYVTAKKYIQDKKFVEIVKILKLIQNYSNWKNENLINFGEAASALVPYHEKAVGGTGDNMKCIKWNVVQSESAVLGPAEQMQVALLEQHLVSGHYHGSRTRALRYEDQSDLFTQFCSQIKNIGLVCLLVVFTMTLVAFYNIFSLVPRSCQKYSFAQCTDSSFWSILKALLCPQIRLRNGAPPPV